MNTSELNSSRLPLVETSSETMSLALFGSKISSLPGPAFSNWTVFIKEPLIKAFSVVILFPHPLARLKYHLCTFSSLDVQQEWPYVPIHNSFSSVCVFIKVLEGNSHWIFICDFLLSCHVKNTMSENNFLYLILCLHSMNSFRLAVFACKNWVWVTPLLTFPPQYKGDSTWPRLKSNWRVYQQKNRAIVLLSAGTWLPCPLKRLLFWGFLHRITSEIAISNGYQP